LSASDAPSYRTVFLAALRAHPAAFAASAEDESALVVEDFAQRLSGSDSAIFGVLAGDDLAAIATFVSQPLRKRRHIGMIWGMYVRPEYEGAGMGKQLMRHVLEFAESRVDQVELYVNTTNDRARSLYTGMGFERYGVMRRALRVEGTDHDADMLVKVFR
jgi:ribosomal protein S18 acetylase RimI-like enzyme